MIRRTILEWDKLPYGLDRDDKKTIPRNVASRLAAAAAMSSLAGKEGGRVLDARLTALRARDIVGVVVADSCALEILPKIDVTGITAEEKASAIRRRLVHMLAVAFDLHIDVGRLTALDWQNKTLLEVLIRVFSEKLTDAVRLGMPRRYIACEDDLPALRGALNVTRQFTRHATNPARLACRFDILSEDISLNRIMKAAVSCLRQLAQASDNQRCLGELAFAYADISDVPVCSLRWDEVVLDRTNERWRDLLAMARLLLEGRYQTTSSGSGQGFSLLFKMDTLFEAYVGRLVKRALAGSGLHAVLQGGHRFCLTHEGNARQSFQTKPDILIKRGNEVLQIVDTKWKRLAPQGGTELGVKQPDVYQMMAYGHLYHCTMLTLLYPHHGGLGSVERVLASHRIAECDRRLQVTSFDVADGQDFVARLRRLLLEPEELSWAG